MEQEPYFSPSELIPSLISRIRASLAKNSVGGFTYIIGNNGTGKSRALSEISLLLEKKTVEIQLPVSQVPFMIGFVLELLVM